MNKVETHQVIQQTQKKDKFQIINKQLIKFSFKPNKIRQIVLKKNTLLKLQMIYTIEKRKKSIKI